MGGFQIIVMAFLLITGTFTFDLDVNFLDDRFIDSEFTGKG
jgi:hypothetical protein